MKTKMVKIEGITFVVPKNLIVPMDVIGDYPPCCGPGSRFIERIVPETFWGMSVSLACWIHDRSLEEVEATPEGFEQINSMLLSNLLTLINARHSISSWFLKPIRNCLALSYYKSCNSIAGWAWFCKYKEAQRLKKQNEKKRRQEQVVADISWVQGTVWGTKTIA